MLWKKKIIQAIRLISAPVTIVAAEDDKLVKVDVTKKCVPYFSHNDSSLRVLQGAGHEIFNEIDPIRNEALADLLHWTQRKYELKLE